MTKLELVAASLWREDAVRCSAPSVAERRTYEAFQGESTETQDKWLGYARAALSALSSKEPD